MTNLGCEVLVVSDGMACVKPFVVAVEVTVASEISGVPRDGVGGGHGRENVSEVISWSAWDFGGPPENVLKAGLCHTLLSTPSTCLQCLLGRALSKRLWEMIICVIISLLLPPCPGRRPSLSLSESCCP